MTPSSGPEPTAALDSTRSGKEPVIVHVLFLDIVGSSSQPSDLQQRTTSKLQEVVMGTREFLEERARGDLISIPTGDGMALVFLRNNPELPLRCGIEIARAVRANPFCKIRMGVNSGLVFFTFDINGNQNVSGAGINLAERIMSCGGSGQLLVSNSTAESLVQLTTWKNSLQYLGEYRAKKDWVRVWNYTYGGIGSDAPLNAPSRRAIHRRRVLLSIAGGGILAAGGLSLLTEKHTPEDLLEHSLMYSLAIQDANGQVQELAPDAIPPSGARIKLKVSSAQGGYLYVLIRGADNAAGQNWTWIFPEPRYQRGSGELPAKNPVSIPTPPNAFIELDEQPGQEIVDLIWSERPVEQLENIKRSLFARMSDELSSTESGVVANLASRSAKPAQYMKNRMDTLVHAKNSIIVAQFPLGHM